MIRIIRVAAPETELPEDFPGEDLDFLGEVPSPQEIAGNVPLPTNMPVLRPAPKGQAGSPYYEVADFTFLPFGKGPEATPEDPAKMFEEIYTPETPIEEANRVYQVREKIWRSLNRSIPMKIQYKTLEDEMGRTAETNRVIRPDYVYWAGTNRHILVAWCDMRNDWRAFAVDNIITAELLGD